MQNDGYFELYQKKLHKKSQVMYSVQSINHKQNTSKIEELSIERQETSHKSNQLTYRQKLKKIYDLYSLLGESMYTSNMKLKKFFQLLTELNIINKGVNKTNLELLIFKTVGKKIACFDFDTFVKCLYSIADAKYSHKEGAFQAFLDEYLLPHYDKLFASQIAFSSKSSFKQEERFEKDTSLLINKIGTLNPVDDLTIHKDYEIMLYDCSYSLYEIYKYYFPLELAPETASNYSIKQLIKFLTEFEMFPYLIIKDELYQIYQHVIDSDLNSQFATVVYKAIREQSIGNQFNFFRFLQVLFHVADTGLDKIPISAYIDNGKSTIKNTLTNKAQNKYTTYEKICLILERMELSDIFPRLNLKFQIGNHIIDQSFLDNIKKDIDKREQVLYKNLNKSNVKEDSSENSSMITSKQESVFQYYEYIFDKYSKELHCVFKLYSEDINNLRLTKFKRMLCDSGLIKNNDNEFGLTLNIIDLIYTKITRGKEKETLYAPIIHNNNYNNNEERQIKINSSTITQRGTENNHESKTSTINAMTSRACSSTRDTSGSNSFCLHNSNTKYELSFGLFINVVELLSKKLFPNKDVQDAIDLLCKKFLFRLCRENPNEDNLLDLIYREKEENPDFERVYNIFFQTIFPIFNIYINQYGVIDIKAFYKFAYDFNLFPQSVTKNKLNHLFKSTYTHRKDIKDDIYNIRTMSLDHKLFCNVLVQIAFEISYGIDDPNDIEKIIFLADRLSQSDGMNQIITSLLTSTKLTYGKNFDIMALFKEHYPNYFCEEEDKKDTIGDILDQPA